MMRRITTLILVLGVLLLVGCGGGGGDDDSPQSTVVPVADPTATPIPAATTPPTPAPTKMPTQVPTPTPLATQGDFFLQLVEPAETEVFTNVGSLMVMGRTRVDAVVTINDAIVEPNIDGEFSLDVVLEEGPNIIEVVASVASGEQKDFVLVAIFIP